MAQLSMWEKQKHYSKKDFTCSIGKHDVIYITFRNKSWERFTTSEKIAVYVGASGALRFDDPANNKGVILKMKTGTGHKEVTESTRYIQLSGRKYPTILDVVRRTTGSYNFPAEASATEKADRIKEELKEFTEKCLAKHQATVETNEEKTLRELFKEDALELLKDAQTPEERVAIYNALGHLYGALQLAEINKSEQALVADIKNIKKLTPPAAPITSGDDSKWVIP